MKVLLDTTYLLPAVGISVRGMPTDAAERLVERGDEVHICEISTFELVAKAAKHVAEGRLSPERVTRGINAIIYDDAVVKVSANESAVLFTAFALRRELGDFIDCLILSASMNRCDCLVTEDDEIHAMKEKSFFSDAIRPRNPSFRISTLQEILHS